MIYGRSPDARLAIPRLTVLLPPAQLAPPCIQPLEVTAPWQTLATSAGACAPQNSLRAELLAVRAEAATASAQLHGCQAQLAQVILIRRHHCGNSETASQTCREGACASVPCMAVLSLQHWTALFERAASLYGFWHLNHVLKDPGLSAPAYAVPVLSIR